MDKLDIEEKVRRGMLTHDEFNTMVSKINELAETSDKKVEVVVHDEGKNMMLAFGSQEAYESYQATGDSSLLIASWEAPYNYKASITMLSETYNAILLGTTGNVIRYTFDVTNKDDASTGEGVTATYVIQNGNTSQTVTQRYRSGQTVEFNVDEYLKEGTNLVRISLVSTDTLVTTSIAVTYQAVNLSLETDYDISTVHRSDEEGGSAVEVGFTVSGSGTKTMEWYVDGEQLAFDQNVDEVLNTTITRTKYIDISGMAEGVHSLQLRASVTVNGTVYYSRTLYRDLMVHNGTEQTPQIAISHDMAIGTVLGAGELPTIQLTQYTATTLTFAAYNPVDVAQTDVVVSYGDTRATVATHNAEVYAYDIVAETTDVDGVTLTCGETARMLPATTEALELELSEITSNLQFSFDARSRSNDQSDKETWSYGDYKATFTNVKWNSASGWVDGALRLSNASVAYNIAPLTPNPATKGKTLEFEFMVDNVTDDDEVICDMRNTSGTGLLITSSEITLTSDSGQAIGTRYSQREYNRISLVINRASGVTDKTLVLLYINGIVSGAIHYATGERFTSTKTMTFAATTCAVSLRQMRFYDVALTADNVLNNYTLYRQTSTEMLRVYNRNDIYTEGTTEFDLEKIGNQLPYMILTGDVATLNETGNKNTQVIMQKVEYVDVQDDSKSFTGVMVAMRPQGTSSMKYFPHNFRLYTKRNANSIFYWSDGKMFEANVYELGSSVAPATCFCLKADVAESSSSHNTGSARLFNDTFYDTEIAPSSFDGLLNTLPTSSHPLRTMGQEAAQANGHGYKPRTAIYGFPIVLFSRTSENDPLQFVGKYNFNLDKSAEAAFGWGGDIEGYNLTNVRCVETLNNGDALANFTKVDDFNDTVTSDGSSVVRWTQAFEFRYPDGSTKDSDVAALKRLCDWLNACKDDPEKYEAEKEDYLDLPKVAAYYVFVMRLGAVDQTVKNSMLCTEDGLHWFYIWYDGDTICGVRNDGKLLVGPYVDRQSIDPSFVNTEYYYAGHDSVMWNCFEANAKCMSIVRIVDAAMYQAGFTRANILDMFNNQQSGKWCERIYNQDARYKYISPYTTSGNTVQVPMLQGSRKSHRSWWLTKRMALYDSLFVTGDYTAHSFSFKGSIAAGSTFSITGGMEGYYGYGVNNVVKKSGVSLSRGENYTFTIDNDLKIGDPTSIYMAPHLMGVDLSGLAEGLSEVSVGNVYDESLGSQLQTLVLGGATADAVTNIGVTSISGLDKAVYLEELNVNGYKGITSLDLSGMQYFKSLYALGSGLKNLTLAEGAPVETLALPGGMQTIALKGLEIEPEGLTFEDSGDALTSISIQNCPNLAKDPDFLLRWIAGKYAEDKDCTLDVTLDWSDVTVTQLTALGEFLQSEAEVKLRGKAVVSECTPAEITALKELFGDNAFTQTASFFIQLPDGVYVTGPTSIVSGDGATYKADVFSDYKGTVEFSITSGSGATIDAKTGVLTTTEGSARTITIQAKHTPTQGSVVYDTLTVSIVAAVYPTGASIVGDDVMGSSGEYTLTVQPTSGINRSYSVAWTVSGDQADVVTIASQSNSGCSLTAPEDGTGTFTLTATVTKQNGTTLTASKEITLGTVLTIKMKTNHDGPYDKLEQSATVTYNNVTTTVANGDSIGVPYGITVTVTFPSMEGYWTPPSKEIVASGGAVEVSALYKSCVLFVTLKAFDGADVTGQQIYVDGRTFTWEGTQLGIHVPWNGDYTITASDMDGYTTPSEDITTWNNAGPLYITLEYGEDVTVGTWITIDDTVTDPATKISGSVNGDDIQLIRNNSHRVLAKLTAEGTMTYYPLNDSNSEQYDGGETADLTGSEGDVFVKLPTFFYKHELSDTDIHKIGFYYGTDSPGDGWNKWDTNFLIGAYEAYVADSKVYSRSGVDSTDNVSQTDFKAYARDRDSKMCIVTWQMHCVMAFLFFGMYGNTNSQAICGSGTDSHTKTMGMTNSLGMTDTDSANGNSMSINFWGLENWWGNKVEWVDNLVTTNNYYWTITEADGSTRQVDISGISNIAGYPTKIRITDNGDVLALDTSGSSSSGYCDFIRNYTGNGYVAYRSGGYANEGCGVLCVRASGSYTGTYAAFGSRLAFIGVSVKASSVEAFKALEMIG